MPTFYGHTIESPLLLGTAQYPSPAVLIDAFKASGAGIATVSLRRQAQGGAQFRDLIKQLDVAVLPNTSGCHTAKEAVTTAHMARELFATPWIKLEVIGNTDTLQPDVLQLVEAAQILSQEGFQVFPYCTEDLSVCEQLVKAGCQVLMPWGAPIGSGMGLNNRFGLRSLRAAFADIPLVVDAGIGLPSHAAQAMELGYDAVLLNSAVAKAGDPAMMARAMATAIEAGHQAYLAKPMPVRDMAIPSSPLIGQAFLA